MFIVDLLTCDISKNRGEEEFFTYAGELQLKKKVVSKFWKLRLTQKITIGNLKEILIKNRVLEQEFLDL
jgi:hypothetical protein